MMQQQASKQLETNLHSFGDICCLYTAVLVSPGFTVTPGNEAKPSRVAIAVASFPGPRRRG